MSNKISYDSPSFKIIWYIFIYYEELRVYLVLSQFLVVPGIYILKKLKCWGTVVGNKSHEGEKIKGRGEKGKGKKGREKNS